MDKKIKLFDIDGNDKGTVAFDTALFIEKPHKQSMFDCVIAENAAERQGTHSTLTKGEVRGGGKKPWKQKHTGKARTGSTRNPHWVGGGVAFGPKPNRNYLKKVNSKVFKLAFKSALSLKLSADSILALVDKVDLKKPSTKTVVSFLNKLNLNDKKVLFITNDVDNLNLSINNIEKATSKKWNSVSVKDLMHAKVIVLQEGTLSKIKEVYA